MNPTVLVFRGTWAIEGSDEHGRHSTWAEGPLPYDPESGRKLGLLLRQAAQCGRDEAVKLLADYSVASRAKA